MRNTWCVRGIGEYDGGSNYLGTTLEATGSRWQAWWIGDKYIDVGRERWAQCLDKNDDRGVGGGSRKDDAPERTSMTAEAAVCLRAQRINNNDGGVGGRIWAWGLSADDGAVVGGRGIADLYEGSETTPKAARAWRQAQGIYDNEGGVNGGRWARRLQQQQRRCRRRIDDASKRLETTTEAAAYRRQARCIGNGNRVLIFLAITSLPVTLSCLCLVAVSFWYCFYQIPFFSRSLQEILLVLQSRGKYFCTKCTLTLRIYPLHTG